MRLSRRIFVITLTIALAALTGLTLVTSSWMRDTLREASLRRIADSVNRETRVLQRSLDLLKSDALFIAELDAARFAAARPASGEAAVSDARAALGKTLAAMMSRRPSYTQMRLISAFDNGRELVRVNRGDEGIVVVPEKDLQNKGDRYYVEESLKVASGTLYVSPVDLNQEHDRIVEPHEPVFRVGTPVVAADGTVVGAVVVNIRFDTFVGEMVPPNPDITLAITNEAGDYLSHPEAAKRFGFEFGRPIRIQDDLGIAPQWAAVLTAAPVAHILGERGIGVVFDRITLTEGPGAGRSLIVAAIAPVTELDAQAQAFGLRTLGFAVALAIGLAIALGFATSRLTRPVEHLTAAAARIGAGERNVALPPDRGDEIGVLTRTIAQMLQALREAARGEEMASMGRMASQVAHDLRNALSPVKMNIQILARRHASPDDPEARHLAIAAEQIQYIESILSDMLAFARGEALRVEPIDLAGVISAAVLSEIEALETRNILLTTRGAEDVRPLEGDRVKLTQVFQNLIENAVQASPEGGRIDVVARDEDAATLIVEVIDHGEGIPDDVRARVFEPYFTTRTRGTGLGLAIVSRIVKQHGGDVTIAKTPGGGTTVRVELPLAREGWGM